MDVRDVIAGAGGEAPLPVYLFCPGKAPRARLATFEPVLADRAVEAIVRRTVDPDNKDLALTNAYADETSAADIVSEAQTLPFLVSHRVMIVRNAERYTSEAHAGPLLTYLENPNESTVLLFIAYKMDKRTKFYKACQKAGAVVECPALSDRDVAAWIRVEVEAREKRIDDSAIAEILARAGTNLSDVNNAIDLAAGFVGEASDRIREEDVQAACADVAEEEIWALTDAIAASEAGRALDALRNLLDLGKHPDEIIGTINWLLKNAYLIATADGEPMISRFVSNKVRPLSQKLGVAKLRAAFALCTETQFQQRSTGVDGALALELLVLKLAAPMPRRKSA